MFLLLDHCVCVWPCSLAFKDLPIHVCVCVCVVNRSCALERGVRLPARPSAVLTERSLIANQLNYSDKDPPSPRHVTPSQHTHAHTCTHTHTHTQIQQHEGAARLLCLLCVQSSQVKLDHPPWRLCY